MSNPFQITCHICNEIFFIHEFGIHIQTAHPQNLCPFCGLPSSNFGLLAAHFLDNHSKCSHCAFVSEHIGRMIDHMRTQHQGNGLLPRPTFRMPSFTPALILTSPALPEMYPRVSPSARTTPIGTSFFRTGHYEIPSNTIMIHPDDHSSIKETHRSDSNHAGLTPSLDDNGGEKRLAVIVNPVSPPASQGNIYSPLSPSQRASVALPAKPKRGRPKGRKNYYHYLPLDEKGKEHKNDPKHRGTETIVLNINESRMKSKDDQSLGDEVSVSRDLVSDRSKDESDDSDFVEIINSEVHDSSKVKLICEYCQRHFLSLNGLNRHQTTIHPEKLADQFVIHCPLCPKKFRVYSSLRNHLTRQHPDEKPKSPHCDYRARTSIQSYCAHSSKVHQHLDDSLRRSEHHTIKAAASTEEPVEGLVEYECNNAENGDGEAEGSIISDTSSVDAILIGSDDVISIIQHEIRDDNHLYFLVEGRNDDEAWLPLSFFKKEKKKGAPVYSEVLATYAAAHNLKL